MSFDPTPLEVTPTQMTDCLETLLLADDNISTILIGPPGIGKTHIVYDVCKKLGWKMFDFMLTAQDPVDISGLPTPKEKYFTYLSEQRYYLASTEIPDGPPMVLFFDDLPAAEKQVLNAFFKLAHERKVGTYTLRDNVKIVAAGNRTEHNAGSHDMPTALNNRFLFKYVKVDADSWCDWAIHNHLEPVTVGFIRSQNNMLHTFDPNATDPSFASPRSWHMLSNVLKAYNKAGKKIDYSTVAGAVGSCALAFKAFMDHSREAVPVKEILKDPLKARVPGVKEVDAMFSTITNLEFWMHNNPKDWKPIASYSVRDEVHPELAARLAKRVVDRIIHAKDDAKGMLPEFISSPEYIKIKDRFQKDFNQILNFKVGA